MPVSKTRKKKPNKKRSKITIRKKNAPNKQKTEMPTELMLLDLATYRDWNKADAKELLIDVLGHSEESLNSLKAKEISYLSFLEAIALRRKTEYIKYCYELINKTL